jgi:hypothetical protein
MKKTLMALAAVATVAVSAVAAPQTAEARNGRIAAGVAAGLIGGAIVGGALAGPGYYGYGPGYGPGYGYYGGPAYVADDYYGACVWQRQRFWDGYGWRVRRVQQSVIPWKTACYRGVFAAGLKKPFFRARTYRALTLD